ncbi:MAG: hypothetical protein JXA73_14300 [Acidobacteria bacterium]|nr:hypothetical protein [Acidobacteriota bacterium]
MEKHAKTPGFTSGLSEPEHFVEFAERIPEWCVVIGLIGSGREIHVGEEAGLVQWRYAVEQLKANSRWIAHGAPEVGIHFNGKSWSSESTQVIPDRAIHRLRVGKCPKTCAILLVILRKNPNNGSA